MEHRFIPTKPSENTKNKYWLNPFQTGGKALANLHSGDTLPHYILQNISKHKHHKAVTGWFEMESASFHLTMGDMVMMKGMKRKFQ